jgi:hypothetical protein
MNVKKKVAFIKFGGMAIGGTEKVLQTIASGLPKNKYEVDFFYCDAAPYIGSNVEHPNTEPSRIKYCEDNGVNLIKFNVEFKDVRVPTHDWVNTNFWEKFNEDQYDLLITGRGGYPEYPFYLINKLTTIDTIHLSDHAEIKHNVFKSILISKEQRKKWITAGGLRRKSLIIPNPVEIKLTDETYDIKNKFIFGMHQRDDDYIFSPIPLEAYKEVESSQTMFLLLGGSSKYKDQANYLGIKNIQFLPTTASLENIHKFLNTLDVYAHGRKDGEQCSTAIIEAMSHGLPLVSHTAPSMGQKEQIGDGGLVVKNVSEYANTMKRFMEDKSFFQLCSKNSLKRYKSHYQLEVIISKYIEIIEEAVVFKSPSQILKKFLIFESIVVSIRVTFRKLLKRVLKKLKKELKVLVNSPQ